MIDSSLMGEVQNKPNKANGKVPVNKLHVVAGMRVKAAVGSLSKYDEIRA